MKREITFTAAFDKRHKDPNKNYGIHGAEMRAYLIGDLGAVQFVLYTNWQLPHVRKETEARILSKARSYTTRSRRVTKIKGISPDELAETIDKIEGIEHHPGGLDRIDLSVAYHPTPADLGYHSPKPLYADQTSMDCSIIPGGKCYYDGSTLQAEPVYEALVSGGSDAMWKYLEDYYNETFGELR